MAFAQFVQLPNRLGSLPEIFRPVNIPAPPVYDTGALVKPILNLAEYLSPESRAKRKAAVAKANFEYRMYSSDNMATKDPFYYYKLREYQDRHRRTNAYINKAGKGAASYETPAMKAFKKLRPKQEKIADPAEESDETELMESEGLGDVSLGVAYADEEETE